MTPDDDPDLADLAARPYAGPDDLARMEALLSASWRAARPFVSHTPGDLEWWQVLAPLDADWRQRIRLWESGGSLVAFAWFDPPADLDWEQRAGLGAETRSVIVTDAIAWATELARAGSATGGMTPPDALRAWTMDADAGLCAILERLGWAPDPMPAYTHWYQRLDGDPDAGAPAGSLGAPSLRAPSLPAGYRLRHVRLPEDLERRVEVHRAAFAPSRMTVARYETLAAMPHYAPERDLVVEAPDGSFAAFTMVWWDPDGRIGEFEPVGTHPDHRQRGLAQAVNLAGLRILRDLGAVDALVLSACANEASEALYGSAGFEAVTRHRAWTHRLG